MSEGSTERGLKLFGEIMGADRETEMRAGLASDHFGAALGQLAVDYAFGDVWAREGLARDRRSLVVIGVLIAQRQTAELKNHIRIALTNGLTPREIEEALIQTAPYVGFPAVASATTAIIEVLREAGIDTVSRTSQERGML